MLLFLHLLRRLIFVATLVVCLPLCGLAAEKPKPAPQPAPQPVVQVEIPAQPSQTYTTDEAESCPRKNFENAVTPVAPQPQAPVAPPFSGPLDPWPPHLLWLGAVLAGAAIGVHRGTNYYLN